MSISGVFLHARPDAVDEVLGQLARRPEIEVHASTSDGRIILTIDQPDDAVAGETFITCQNMQGVLSASLVCTYFDDDPAGKELNNDHLQA